MGTFILRKIAAKPALLLVLFIGITLACALVCTIPMYSAGILTRLLVLDLQTYQHDRNSFPGTISVKTELRFLEGKTGREELLAALDQMDKAVASRLDGVIDKPVLSRATVLTRQFLTIRPAEEEETEKKVFIDLVAQRGYGERIRLLQGREPRRTAPGEALEVLVSEGAAYELNLVLDKPYLVKDGFEEEAKEIPFMPVGIFVPKDPSDTFWQNSIWLKRDAVFMDESMFRDVYLNLDSGSFMSVDWFWSFDYHTFTADDVPVLLKAYKEASLQGRSQGMMVTMLIQGILESYEKRRDQLSMILWMILTPVLLMEAFFLLMTARTFIDHERNEIAVLKSRGAGSVKIFSGYVLLGLILALPAAVAGPFVSLLFCNIIGAADGFLEFVHRKKLDFVLNRTIFVPASLSALAALAVVLAPAAKASRATIVEYKRERFRADGLKAAGKIAVDLAFLGVAAYGIFQYRGRKLALTATGAEVLDFSIDPILFVSATCFLIGAGLLLLRAYPLAIRWLFKLGRDRWSPALFASLIQVGRGGRGSRSLMLFLILSLGTGVFNADSARTLNTHGEDKERYLAGAPVAIMEQWETTEVPDLGGSGGPPEAAAPSADKAPSKYIEPDFRRFAELTTVDAVSKVYRREDCSVTTTAFKNVAGVTIMALTPHEFGPIAWGRDDLFPYHINNYLNLLSQTPQAAIVSSNLLKDFGLELGESLRVRIRDQQDFDVVIYGAVDYWPSYNPFSRYNTGKRGYFLATNFSYFQAMTSLEPYEVWMRPKPGVESAELYEDLKKARIDIQNIRDASQGVIKAGSDPMLLGMNGSFTFSFLMSMAISLAGFLLYWSFAVRERTLQFGVFRAMGLSRLSVFAMLGMEQLLVSGTAVALGLFTGTLASRLFVPLLEVTRKAEQQILPFRVVSLQSDRLRILAVVAVMLGAGCAMLVYMMRKMKIAEAVKLGEE